MAFDGPIGYSTSSTPIGKDRDTKDDGNPNLLITLKVLGNDSSFIEL